MGAQESKNRNSCSKASAGRVGRRNLRLGQHEGRANLENQTVFPAAESIERGRDSAVPQIISSRRPSGQISLQTATRGTGSLQIVQDSYEELPSDNMSRGRVAYMKAVKKARCKGPPRPHKISHQSIVNSMSSANSMLAGMTSMPVFGKQLFLNAVREDGAKVPASTKGMRRSRSEQIVGSSNPPTRNRVRDQMKKEKQMNEQLRMDGKAIPGSQSRTQSFFLPRSLNVIPEQPEDESKDPEKYSYSEINVYF